MDLRSFFLLYIHLYFIGTKYWWNNAFVEDIDNWTRSYNLVIIVLYYMYATSKEKVKITEHNLVWKILSMCTYV